MDINATLVSLFNELSEESPNIDTVRELIDAVDGWLTNGGFLPKRWAPASGSGAAPSTNVGRR